MADRTAVIVGAGFAGLAAAAGQRPETRHALAHEQELLAYATEKLSAIVTTRG